MRLKKISNNALNIHLLCWAIFIIYEVLITAYLAGKFSHIAYYLLFYLLNITLFYVHALFVLPKALKPPGSAWWRLPVLIIIECGLYLSLVILNNYILDFIHLRKSELLTLDWKFFTLGFWRWANFALYGTGYYFLLNYLSGKQREMVNAIENEKLKLSLAKSEKDFLRTQINPHLLFNTLNFVKFAAKNRPDEANEAIIRLSEIMRFALRQSNTELIGIKDELNQVKNIIELNQLRFDHALHIKYTEKITTNYSQIIPVVLLTLVENVFKHGNLSEAIHPAEIHIHATTGRLKFKTRNLANTTFHDSNEHTGIKGIILRLNLCYGQDYVFNYGLENNIYTTYLDIPLRAIEQSKLKY